MKWFLRTCHSGLKGRVCARAGEDYNAALMVAGSASIDPAGRISILLNPVFTVLGLLADFLLPIWWGLAATLPALYIAWWVAYRSDWF